MKWFNKYGIKIISWTIFILSLWLLYRRFFVLKQGFEFTHLKDEFSSAQWLFGVLAFVLVFANWGIEAVKWQFVTKPIQSLSYITAFKSVFMGVAVSTVFPNRTGEFLGKILVLGKHNKVKGIFASLISSLSQLFITLFCGLLSFIFCRNLLQHTFNISSEIYFWCISLLVLSLLVYLLLPHIVLFLERFISKRWMQYIEFCKNYSFISLLKLYVLSFLRYTVFVLQLYLLFVFFNQHITIMLFIQLASVAFMLTTVIPTMALSELFVRSNVGLMIFSTTGISDEIIVTVYTLLWIINIALPALTGFLFGLGMKWKN